MKDLFGISFFFGKLVRISIYKKVVGAFPFIDRDMTSHQFSVYRNYKLTFGSRPAMVVPPTDETFAKLIPLGSTLNSSH